MLSEETRNNLRRFTEACNNLHKAMKPVRAWLDGERRCKCCGQVVAYRPEKQP